MRRSMRRIVPPLLLLCALSTPGLSRGQLSPGDPGSADRDWRFVERLLADGMEDVAARQLEGFATEHAADPRAAAGLMRAASIYRRLDQSVAALAAYDRLLAEFPTSPEAPGGMAQKGELLAEAERFEDAANTYRGLLTSFPASAYADQARLGLGEASLALGRSDEAGRLFRHLIGGRASEPIAARAMFDLGVLNERAGADSVAIDYFDNVSQRYPGEVMGAFGLLRSAELLVAAEAPGAAERRYRQVSERYSDPYLTARAHLGLAQLDEAAGRLEPAAKSYREVAERGGSPEQVQLALLGLARSELARGRPKDARRAAESFVQTYPDVPGAARARLVMAQVDAEAGLPEAIAGLRLIATRAGGQIAFDAQSSLARVLERSEDARAARNAWQDAARLAPDGDTAADALMQAARIAGDSQNKRALAAELYIEASTRAASDEVKARALWNALRQRQEAGDEGEALALAEQLSAEHPLQAQAAEARAVATLLRRRLGRRPDEAARRLSDIALDPQLDNEGRALEAGRVLRDLAGDGERSLEVLSALWKDASNPVIRAQAALELGKTRESLALDAALNGDSAGAKDRWAQARASYVDAASAAGAEAEARRARIALLRLELCEAARPDAAVLFDAEGAPLLGGVGALESLDLTGANFAQLAGRFAANLELAPDRSSRSWMLWRMAELSHGAAVEQRIAYAKEGLETARSDGRKQALRYCLGQLQLMAGDDDAAARELREVLKESEGTDLGVAARYSMAELHRGAKRYEQARTLYEAYAGAYPASQRGQRARLLAGDCALYSGDPQAAVAQYRRILENDANGVYADDANYRLGTAQLRLGRIEAARESFGVLAQASGSSRYAGRSLLKLADLEASAGNDSAAVYALERLESVDPQLAHDENVAERLAVHELGRGRGAQALRWLDRADEGQEESVDRLGLRVQALAVAGRLDDAQKALTRLAEGYPNAAETVAEARLAVADARLAKDDSAAAAEQYRRAGQESGAGSLRARAAYGEGMAALRASAFDEAVDAYQRAVAFDSQSEWAAQGLFKIGGITARQGDDERAQRAYTRLAEDHPRHELAPEALAGAALAWRRMSRFDKALELYHGLLENYPDAAGGEEILSNIAYCYHEMGDFEVCIGAYERVLPLLDEEGQAYAQFWIADSLEQLGRNEDAAASYLKIPYLYPEAGQLPVTAQLKAATVYERMGNPEAAIRLYEKVIQTHGRNSQWGAEAVKRLERMDQAGDAES